VLQYESWSQRVATSRWLAHARRRAAAKPGRHPCKLQSQSSLHIPRQLGQHIGQQGRFAAQITQGALNIAWGYGRELPYLIYKLTHPVVLDMLAAS
jgi:hypothetical protein